MTSRSPGGALTTYPYKLRQKISSRPGVHMHALATPVENGQSPIFLWKLASISAHLHNTVGCLGANTMAYVTAAYSGSHLRGVYFREFYDDFF